MVMFNRDFWVQYYEAVLGYSTSHDAVKPKSSTDRGFFRAALTVKDHSNVPANRRRRDSQDVEIGQKILGLLDLCRCFNVHLQLWQPAL
ncbi:hypothetical protein BG24_692 [Burkholderia pseudomallei PB08298010]|nr:hypothetical protein BG24_692 [Burkholderia pseudomallei PB08298010]